MGKAPMLKKRRGSVPIHKKKNQGEERRDDGWRLYPERQNGTMVVRDAKVEAQLHAFRRE